jgi:hypothetical protein
VYGIVQTKGRKQIYLPELSAQGDTDLPLVPFLASPASFARRVNVQLFVEVMGIYARPVDEGNRDISVSREKVLIHSGRERPARELDRSAR